MQAISTEADEFLEDLHNWERNPKSYTQDSKLHDRINRRFYTLVLGLVTRHHRAGSVYVTRDVVFGADALLSSYLESNYQRVPQGLVFQLFSDKSFQPSVPVDMNLRGLSGRNGRSSEDDVVKLKVIPVYVDMFISRGYFLMSHGDIQGALQSFRAAEALDPERRVVRRIR